MSLIAFQSHVAEKTELLLRRYFENAFQSAPTSQHTLKAAIDYALFSGGKRFRPTLACAVAQALGEKIDVVIPWAAAVEMIHTYSLIHDDLPCMDNDDLRRGQPTTHKKFDEATALLAGDALLTESFLLLVSELRHAPDRAGLMVALLAQAAGVRGMIGGQVADIHAQSIVPTLPELELLHRQKTGALIQCAAQGAAILIEAPEAKIELAAKLGQNLGLAFQIADDLLDHEDQNPEKGSYPAILGVLRTQELLRETTNQALECARAMGGDSGPLIELVQFNLQRDI